jgi:UDP-N-acetylmuramoyl-L-alanyl-D-glutamate--2,6-diaminopimelate ligase
MGSPGLPLGAVARRLREAGVLLSLSGSQDLTVRGVSQDSRRVSPGDLFLAWKGSEHDGHAFLSQAAAAGAVAAVVEQRVPEVAVPQLQVLDGRLGAALAADTVFGSPWTGLFLAGITGTNGKTTTAFLARHLLQQRGPARALGTLGLVEESGAVRPGTEGLTTPGPVEISGYLRDMTDDGVRYAVMEVSSHALDQRRVDGVALDAAVFTNLGRDHLDYHPDLDSYRRAKTRMLDLLKPSGWAVVNRNEEAWESLPVPQGRALSYGFDDGPGFHGEPGSGGEPGPGGGPGPGSDGESGPGGDAWSAGDHVPVAEPVPTDEPGAGGGMGPSLVARDVGLHPSGSRFRLQSGGEEEEIHLPLLGRFNVENALAAAGVARVAGLGLAEIARGLSSAPQVPGRLERVVDAPFPVVIDFAHTPDALETVLSTLRPLVPGRLLVLFGAGGDRDRGKRPRMGAVVARMADLAFVTSDNPRTEDPEAIVDQILQGMGNAPARRIPDRREAIAAVLREGRPGDLVLLAGKGHESHQTVGRERRPFVERAIVKEMLAGGKGARA